MKFRLTWSLTFLALPLLAQHEAHYQEPTTGRLWATTPVVVNEAPSALDAPTGKISAELLKYPLSGKALKMLRKALQFANTGDHADAVKQLQMTVARCPDSGPYTYSLLGVEYIKTDQFSEAIDALQRSVKFLPHDASNHANLGLAFFAQAQYDRAEQELRRALELDPNYKMATRILSVLDTAENTRAALPK